METQSTHNLCAGLLRLNEQQKSGLLNNRLSRLRAEEEADNLLVQFFAEQLHLHLQHHRELGKGGWWCTNECHQEVLEQAFVDAAKVGNVVSTAAFAAMILARLTVENTPRGQCFGIVLNKPTKEG